MQLTLSHFQWNLSLFKRHTPVTELRDEKKFPDSPVEITCLHVTENKAADPPSPPNSKPFKENENCTVQKQTVAPFHLETLSNGSKFHKIPNWYKNFILHLTESTWASSSPLLNFPSVGKHFNLSSIRSTKRWQNRGTEEALRTQRHLKSYFAVPCSLLLYSAGRGCHAAGQQPAAQGKQCANCLLQSYSPA